MKSIFKYTLIGLLAGGMFTACSEDQLDTQPTNSMSGASLMLTSDAAMVPLNGIYRSMYTSGWSTTGNTHQCFGISAYNLMGEVMGDDLIMKASGNGWFWYDAVYNVKARFTASTWRSYDLWFAFYNWISNANYILAAEDTMEGDNVNSVMGQAYAIRAYSYFMLAQCFSRTYVGHENEPCVPIYTEPTSPETEGQPRSTVAQVYAQITSDIQKAVQYLEGTTQAHKSHISYGVARQLQARIALTMEDWQTAKTASEAAIAWANSNGISIQPVAAFDGLNSVDAGNVMWGSQIIADQSGMYAGLFTHMDPAAPYGSRALKAINAELYAKMNDTDERKAAWWTADLINDKLVFADMQTWMGDYIWMRVEEAYLTAAEANCMLGDNSSAQNWLNQLMAKRDPAYNCTKTGTALGALTSDVTGSLREEIINQRRIELWGEYGRVFDIRRLKQGFRRTSAQGWPDAALLSNRPTDNPENYMWVLTIPQAEFDGNAALDASKDQNPTGDQ